MNIVLTNWIVLTGAPSSGKTSVIQELSKLGYAVEDEIPRILIENKLKSGLSLNDILADEEALEKEITEKEIANQESRNPDDLIFLDRALGDRVGYDRYLGMDSSYAFKMASQYKYRNVFIMDLLPFEHDGVRLENQDQAKELDKFFELGYIDLGYDPIRVPVMPVDKRTKFILDKCRL